MKPSVRPYRHAADHERVGAFLVRTYRTEGDHVNWLQPRWEYMHHHPLIQNVDRGRIGVWEEAGRIVGVVHPEHAMGQTYFELDPEHGALRLEMLGHAEEHLAVETDEGRELSIYVGDDDAELQTLAAERGYVRTKNTEPMTRWSVPDPFPKITLPEGFRLQSLADDNDLWKVHCVLWRGFGHGDDPLKKHVEERRFMQSAPNFRRDLNVVVVAPDDTFVSYCGMWIEPTHGVAYVEPVATDPSYRRLGLGRAAVLEGICRCAERGAAVAYVGSTLPIYISIGFRLCYGTTRWRLRSS